MRFDASSLHDSGCDPLEDGHGSLELANTTMERAIIACADASDNKDGVLGDEVQQDVLKLLMDKGLVAKLATGETVLLHACLEYGVKCKGPVLEKDSRSVESSLETEHGLVDLGWSMVDKHKEASVVERRAVRNNHQIYYDLLIKWAGPLESLEAQNLFHHKQSERYYQAIHLAILHRPDELFEVHPYKNSEYYSNLIDFIEGRTRTKFEV